MFRAIHRQDKTRGNNKIKKLNNKITMITKITRILTTKKQQNCQDNQDPEIDIKLFIYPLTLVYLAVKHS
jgi:hypothetical protein